MKAPDMNTYLKIFLDATSGSCQNCEDSRSKEAEEKRKKQVLLKENATVGEEIHSGDCGEDSSEA